MARNLQIVTEYLKRHSSICTLNYSPDRGSRIIVSRDVKKGELVLEETAYCISIDDRYHTEVCAHCLKYFTSRILPFKCEKCEFPYYCSEKCKQSDTTHLPLECDAFIKFKDLGAQLEHELKLMARLALRCVVKGEYEKKQKIANSELVLEDIYLLIGNNELFPEATIKDYTDASHIVNKSIWRDDISKYKIESVLDLICKIQCNTYGHFIDATNATYLAFYYAGAFINHSCHPNDFKFTEETKDGTITHYNYALRDLKAGEDFTISYIELVDSVIDRRKNLQQYCFTCFCERCVDESNGGHTFDKFLETNVCQSPSCKGTVIYLPEGITLGKNSGIICSLCGTNTPNRSQ